MYITVKSIKRKIGFKGIELTDLVIGFPVLFLLLLMFSFPNLRLVALVFFLITLFLFLPINLSKKNRIYKVLWLVINFVKKPKEFIYLKEVNKKEGMINGILKRI